MYSTVARIRDESWFTWNLDITDSFIQWYWDQANWVLLSYVAGIYDASYLAPSALFTGSQAEQMLQRIEELLASWYLLIKEYWLEAKDTDKDWYNKVKEAKDLLMMLSTWDLTLIDNNFAEFAKKNTASAWGIVFSSPDYNSNLDPIFKMSDTY